MGTLERKGLMLEKAFRGRRYILQYVAKDIKI